MTWGYMLTKTEEPHEHGDLSLIARTQDLKPECGACVYNPSAGEVEPGGHWPAWGSLVSQSSLNL